MSQLRVEQEFFQIKKNRRDKEKELMHSYDMDVYFPALRALRDRCVTEHGDHHYSHVAYNGWGGEFHTCGRCGYTLAKSDMVM